MPTGYTSNLQKDYDTKRWLKESVIRAMGLCVHLRDEGAMSEEEIRNSFKKDTEDNYYVKPHKKAQEALALLEIRSTEEWEAAWSTAVKDAKVEYEQQTKDFNEGKEKHIQALQDIDHLLAKAPQDDVILGTLRFAREQLLSTLDFDYNHVLEPKLSVIATQTLDEYKKTQIQGAQNHVSYYAEQLKKEKAKAVDYRERYESFIKFVDGGLDGKA